MPQKGAHLHTTARMHYQNVRCLKYWILHLYNAIRVAHIIGIILDTHTLLLAVVDDQPVRRRNPAVHLTFDLSMRGIFVFYHRRAGFRRWCDGEVGARQLGTVVTLVWHLERTSARGYTRRGDWTTNQPGPRLQCSLRTKSRSSARFARKNPARCAPGPFLPYHLFICF